MPQLKSKAIQSLGQKQQLKKETHQGVGWLLSTHIHLIKEEVKCTFPS